MAATEIDAGKYDRDYSNGWDASDELLDAFWNARPIDEAPLPASLADVCDDAPEGFGHADEREYQSIKQVLLKRFGEAGPSDDMLEGMGDRVEHERYQFELLSKIYETADRWRQALDAEKSAVKEEK